MVTLSETQCHNLINRSWFLIVGKFIINSTKLGGQRKKPSDHVLLDPAKGCRSIVSILLHLGKEMMCLFKIKEPTPANLTNGTGKVLL